MEGNPYTPPAAELVAPHRAPEASDIASRGQRFLNSLIDQIGVTLMGLPVGVVSGLVAPGFIEEVNEFVLGLLLMFGYYVPCEAFFGRTLGKLITGTRAIANDGSVPTTKQILGRTLSRLVPFEAFSFLGPEPCIGWHDRWSGTVVIRTRRRREA